MPDLASPLASPPAVGPAGPAVPVAECAMPNGLGLYQFDARGIAKRFRHAAIFGALGALHKGETMRFYNDHDPLPLLAQIAHNFGSRVQASYLSRNRGEVIIDFTITS